MLKCAIKSIINLKCWCQSDIEMNHPTCDPNKSKKKKGCFPCGIKQSPDPFSRLCWGITGTIAADVGLCAAEWDTLYVQQNPW